MASGQHTAYVRLWEMADLAGTAPAGSDGFFFFLISAGSAAPIMIQMRGEFISA